MWWQAIILILIGFLITRIILRPLNVVFDKSKRVYQIREWNGAAIDVFCGLAASLLLVALIILSSIFVH